MIASPNRKPPIANYRPQKHDQHSPAGPEKGTCDHTGGRKLLLQTYRPCARP